MPTKQYRVGITVNKKLYELLKERSKEEVTTMSKAAKYYLVEGLKSKNVENIDELAE